MLIRIHVEKGEWRSTVEVEVSDKTVLTAEAIADIVGDVLARMTISAKYGDKVDPAEVVRRRMN